MTRIGLALIPLAAVLTACSLVLFAAGHRRPNLLRWARFGWYAQFAVIEVCAALLFAAILTHRFDLDYVFGHSSTNLPLGYLVSTFWSGQEGTFLLWSLYSGIFGLVLMARSREWEPTVMAVFCGVHLLVLGLLLAQSPFLPLAFSRFNAGDLAVLKASFGGVPPEGEGLNKLLQNPWMVIHPPILFLGFSSMAVPFTFACAGLLRRDYDGWAWRCQGWLLFAWSILGLGLILGGYWAYETLGWGGYWGWDPVENSSLAPWLIAGALFHGILRQRATQGLQQRLNLLLAGLSFGAVVYGSYLNRSGVLSDFSVHSFVALSTSFNRALMVFCCVPIAFFLLLLAWRWPTPPVAPKEGAAALSRKRLLAWTTQLLFASGIVVLVGNSWPLLSGPLSKLSFLHSLVPGRSSLQPSFFNWTHTPLAFALLALMAVALLVDWDDFRQEKLLDGLSWPFFLTLPVGALVVGCIQLYLRHRVATPNMMPATAGRLAWAWGSLMVLAVFTALVNLQILAKDQLPQARPEGGWRRLLLSGTALSHSGFALLVLGILGSSVYQTKTMISLPVGQPVDFGGYQITYNGVEPAGAEDAQMQLVVEAGDRLYKVKPLLRESRDGLIRNPAIVKFWTHDLYLEPGEIQAHQDAGEVLLDLTKPLDTGQFYLKFNKFDMGDHEKMDPQNFRVTAEITVRRDGKETLVKPAFALKNGKSAPEPAALPGGGQIYFLNLPQKEGSEERQILLKLDVPGMKEVPETAVMQATLKPLMSVVWLGCWLMILGGLLSALRRAGEAAGRGTTTLTFSGD